MTKILVQQASEKVFTYTVSEYVLGPEFTEFTDFKGIKRIIPNSRIIEVILDD